MLRKSSLVVFSLAILLPLSVAAQQVDIANLRKSVDLLSGVLEEGLRINESPGLFGISLGQVSGVYLLKQGVVVEISSPLANGRNRLNLDALTYSIQDLQSRGSNVFMIQRTVPVPQVMPFSIDPAVGRDAVAESYRALLERINDTDYSALINSALRQANQSLRSLQDLGEIDEQRLQQLRDEADQLRSALQVRQQELQTLVQSLIQRAADANTQTEGVNDEFQGALESLTASMTELRDTAAAKAEELRALHDAARQRQAEAWTAEVVVFENEMYTLLCDYGASLRDLPESEFLTVVLTGLGASDTGAAESRRPDKIHVLSKTDLLRCQSGAIDPAELMQTASVYSY
ncbi:MAG: hypothetical protein WD772_03700 [Pseudohongiellaceae bacterium]